MAMENKRIIQLSTERTTLGDDDYTIVDSDTNGTAKYRLSRLKETDTTLSVSGMAADAAATGQAITAEATARAAADTAIGEDIDDLKSAIKILGVCDIGTDAELIFYDHADRLNVTIAGNTVVTDGVTGASAYVNLDGTPSKLSNKANAPKNFSLIKDHYYTFEVKKLSGSYGDNDDYIYFGVTDGTNWLLRVNAVGGKAVFSPQSNMDVSVLYYVRYGTPVTNLKNEIYITDSVRIATYDELTDADIYPKSIVDGTLINGLYADQTGAFNNDRLDYVCTQGLISVTPNSIIKIHLNGPLNLTAHAVFYDSNRDRVSNVNTAIAAGSEILVSVPSTAYYFVVSLSYAYGYTLDPVDYEIIVTMASEYSIPEKVGVYEDNYDLDVIAPWNNRIYTFGTAVWYNATNRIGLQRVITPSSDIIITCDDGYSFTVGEFSSLTPSVETEVYSSVWVKSHLLEATKHYLINFRKDDDSNISPDDGVYNNHIHYKPVNITTSQDYLIVGFTKRPVYLKHIGTLPNGLQSFCKYGDYYYSTDGDNIYKIDANFNLVSTTPLAVGHGNSFQIGASNIAYISGWDDQTIYCVNMDDITIDSTITLPTTGYTTAAVDDVNGIAYIFQRDTNPNTEDIYNFIVYDYQGETIISTKKIQKPFAAMQACIFVDGKIFAVNGLYANTAPNGYRVYNTLGDVIYEYLLDTIDTEPEGVFYDQAENILYISDSVRRVFLVQ